MISISYDYKNIFWNDFKFYGTFYTSLLLIINKNDTLTSLTWSLLVDSLPEEVAGHADLRLGPLDRDQTVVTPRLK